MSEDSGLQKRREAILKTDWINSEIYKKVLQDEKGLKDN